jgi:outer membrane receptor protein involved in Fe transport
MERVVVALNRDHEISVLGEAPLSFGARTRHRGVEADIDLSLHADWYLGANLSYAFHQYDFDADGRGESFVAGNDVSKAPRWLERLALSIRLNNLLDERYADRADFAGRNYRYLPGRGREAFAELRFSP